MRTYCTELGFASYRMRAMSTLRDDAARPNRILWFPCSILVKKNSPKPEPLFAFERLLLGAIVFDLFMNRS